MKERCDKNDQKDLKDRIILDDVVLAERFGPEEVRFAKNPAEEAAGNSEDYEDDVVDRTVGCPIAGLEKDELACTCGIERFQRDCSTERADKGTPENVTGEICADLFIAEQYTSNWRAKGDRETRRTAG